MKDKKFIYGSVLTVAFLLTVGLTYAYFSQTVSGNDVAETIDVGTTKLELKYTDGNQIIAENIEPGWTTTKTITVENKGNEEAYYTLGWQKLYNEIQKDETLQALNETRVKFLGKKGELTLVLRGMGALSAEERPVIGAFVNEARDEIEAGIELKENELKQKALNEKLSKEKIDITMPSKKTEIGSIHPITGVIDDIKEIFLGLGYEIASGPDIEKTYYVFDQLNTPIDHPARDLQDTFYINDNIVLRSQTSSVQIRVMESQKPPIKIICPGAVYRSDSVDPTHSPVFHQIEGLVVDKGITMSDLKGTLEIFVKKLIKLKQF